MRRSSPGTGSKTIPRERSPGSAHGIRFTGMPAFRQNLSDREIWQMALFAKQMDKLPPGLRQCLSSAQRVRSEPGCPTSVGTEDRAIRGRRQFRDKPGEIEAGRHFWRRSGILRGHTPPDSLHLRFDRVGGQPFGRVRLSRQRRAAHRDSRCLVKVAESRRPGVGRQAAVERYSGPLDIRLEVARLLS
jgi:hypothetical protein